MLPVFNTSAFLQPTWQKPFYSTQSLDLKFLKLGDLVIEAYECDSTSMSYGAIEHIAINVTDIEAVYNLVCRHDLNTLNDQIHFLPFWDNGVKFFTIEGPNKEKVEFSQFL